MEQIHHSSQPDPYRSCKNATKARERSGRGRNTREGNQQASPHLQSAATSPTQRGMPRFHQKRFSFHFQLRLGNRAPKNPTLAQSVPGNNRDFTTRVKLRGVQDHAAARRPEAARFIQEVLKDREPRDQELYRSLVHSASSPGDKTARRVSRPSDVESSAAPEGP